MLVGVEVGGGVSTGPVGKVLERGGIPSGGDGARAPPSAGPRRSPAMAAALSRSQVGGTVGRSTEAAVTVSVRVEAAGRASACAGAVRVSAQPEAQVLAMVSAQAEWTVVTMDSAQVEVRDPPPAEARVSDRLEVTVSVSMEAHRKLSVYTSGAALPVADDEASPWGTSCLSTDRASPQGVAEDRVPRTGSAASAAGSVPGPSSADRVVELPSCELVTVESMASSTLSEYTGPTRPTWGTGQAPSLSRASRGAGGAANTVADTVGSLGATVDVIVSEKTFADVADMAVSVSVSASGPKVEGAPANAEARASAGGRPDVVADRTEASVPGCVRVWVET